MANITGNILAVDSQQHSYLWGSGMRTGSVRSVDGPCSFLAYGIEISDSTTLYSDQSFVQVGLFSDLGLTFWDRTYVGGYMNPDGTMVDGTYLTRLYDPTWINYSIWILTPPTMQGCPTRTALRSSVGHYNASLAAPIVPGQYEIRWRYQPDESSHAKEINMPFTVTSWGIDPFILYGDTFGGDGFGEGGFGGDNFGS
jgi:hypothetical protein